MASSSSTTSSHSQVTQEEFFAFHNIDRQLFFRLVFQIRRDTNEAMQAIAFWIWLERTHRIQCVHTLLTYPDPIIEAVFEETLIALRAAENDEYLISNDTNYEIPNLQNIVGKEKISLKYIHENRIGVLVGVGNIIRQVCARAFQDLIRLFSKYKAMSHQQYYHQQYPNNNPSFKVGDFSVSLSNSNAASSSNYVVNTSNNNNYIQIGSQENLVDLFSNMRMSENNRQSHEAAIPPSERTIFLTFSKGYPISESELRDFLFRSFGDIIETLYMQEVGENDQSLYARLVVRDARAMEVILCGQGKVKFAINGKHVWARKYVRKNPISPPSSPIEKVN
ncbi:hypothetical protein vseg_002849 [Gypsophila vaccaria]